MESTIYSINPYPVDSAIPGGGQSLIWPIRACAAEQGMVYNVLSLISVYNFTIRRLEQGVFLDWEPFKEYEDLR